MAKKAGKLAARAVGWLLRRPGYMLLAAGDERLAAEPPERFANALWGVMAVSLLWGAAMVAVWGAAWKIFPDYDLLIMPAMAATAALCLGPLRRAIAALAETVGGRDATARAVAAAAIVVVVALCFIRLKPDWQRLEYSVLPWWIGWLQPAAKLFRVLLVMPLWGAWSMLIAVKFCKPTARTEPQVAAFARGCGAAAAAGCMAALLGISIAYFHHLGMGSQVSIPAATGLAAIAAGVGLCRLAGGPDRKSLLAANVTTQIVFLLAYLAGR